MTFRDATIDPWRFMRVTVAVLVLCGIVALPRSAESISAVRTVTHQTLNGFGIITTGFAGHGVRIQMKLKTVDDRDFGGVITITGSYRCIYDRREHFCPRERGLLTNGTTTSRTNTDPRTVGQGNFDADVAFPKAAITCHLTASSIPFETAKFFAIAGTYSCADANGMTTHGTFAVGG